MLPLVPPTSPDAAVTDEEAEAVTGPIPSSLTSSWLLLCNFYKLMIPLCGHLPHVGGAPGGGAPMRYGRFSLDASLSSKFGGTDLTNAEVVFLSLAIGIRGAYASSYAHAHYTLPREEAEREAGENKGNATRATEASKKKKEEAAAMAKAMAGAGLIRKGRRRWSKRTDPSWQQ